MSYLPDISWGALSHGLIALPIIACLMVLAYIKYAKQRVRVRMLAEFTAHTLQHYTPWRARIKLLLYWLACVFLLITIMRPQWGEQQEVRMQSGRDLVVGLDVSRSMLAQDFQPNRLEYAKQKIRDLVATLACDRVGLLLFAGSAFMHCPLTRDHATFNQFLKPVDAQTISSGTTALEQALKKAIDTYERMPEKKHKLVVLFTDGEDFSSNLSDIKKQACALGITIFTVGMGTPEGAPVPVVNDKGVVVDHQRDERGAVVMSKLNEGILQALAKDSGGTYIRSTRDNQDIAKICSLVQAYEKEQCEEKSIIVRQERYHYCALASLVLFIIEWLL